MKDPLRVLLLADTHLGFDEPRRPRVQRRRRGPDFFANFERALEPALRGEVDLVVHGGDLLYRSRVPASLVDRALAPLKRVADHGVPVVLALGNHERSHLPFPLLGIHPGVHLLDHPRTVQVDVRGMQVAVSGFPCVRNGISSRFRELLAATGYHEAQADIRLLAIHQTVAGATVGPNGFVFREAPDVIRSQDLPKDSAAVLAGHIHRHQVLRRQLDGSRLATPAFYPGSIERTSFAERSEAKGFLTLEIDPDPHGGSVRSVRFHELPTRPMISLDLDRSRLEANNLEQRLARWLGAIDPNSVVRVRVLAETNRRTLPFLTTPRLRAMAPVTMSIDLHFPRQAAVPSGSRLVSH